MKRFWLFTGMILLTLLAIFIGAEQLGLPSFFDVEGWMGEGSLGVALIGVTILTFDVVLPVPSSLVMIAHGSLFGLVMGTLLSLLGSIGAALLGFFIGRRSSALVVARLVPPDQMARANDLLARWRMVAIVVTRPIPLLAETMVIVAGTSSMSYRQLLVATVAGSLPVAALYALTGSVAANLDATIWSFGLVLLVAGLFWVLREPLNRVLMGNSRSV